MWCEHHYVSGYKRGNSCRFRASAILCVGSRPSLICGYHARGYTPTVIYPLDWNLARIRAWQVENIDRLSARPNMRLAVRAVMKELGYIDLSDELDNIDQVADALAAAYEKERHA